MSVLKVRLCLFSRSGFVSSRSSSICPQGQILFVFKVRFGVFKVRLCLSSRSDFVFSRSDFVSFRSDSVSPSNLEHP